MTPKEAEQNARYKRYLYYKGLIQAPCPFCGSHDLQFSWKHNGSYNETYDPDATGYTVDITCRNCHLKVTGGSNKNEANSCKAMIGRWNNRPAPDNTTKNKEAL